MKQSLQKIWSIIFLITWMGVIFYLSSRPGLSTGLPQDFFIRKVAHVSEYALLTWLTFRAFWLNIDKHETKKRAMLIVTFLFSVVFAVSDEFHQTFVPNREGRLRDVCIDAIGIIGMILVIYCTPHIKRYFLLRSSGKGKK